MKVAVINFSGNVGKTTVARHLLAPRLSADVIAVESVNADDHESDVLRTTKFARLQDYLQTLDDAIVDVGASNIGDLLALMRRRHGSHEDFDYFIVPTVPEIKQQHDTVATLMALHQLGVEADRIRLVFNRLEDDADVAESFDAVLDVIQTTGMAHANPRCCLANNEVYGLAKGTGKSLAELAADTTDYKGLIAATKDTGEKIKLARKLAVQRLARGVLPELDACFAALEWGPPQASKPA